MKKLLISIVVIFILVSKSFAFYDDSNFYWAKDAIDNWYLKGYISGYPDGTFRGNNYITRAEVITVINKLNNSDIKVNKRASKDIELNNWFFEDMGKALEMGIISIDENGNLRPNDFATREEVMVIFSKLFNINYSGNLENSKVKNFIDNNQITSSEYNRVAGIIEEGFVKGYNDNTLKPKNKITRAEFICMLDNIVSEVVSYGNYDNRAFVGNIVVNGSNVTFNNSEILGKVFVLDGAKERLPDFINTNVSKGINSRVGEILLKNNDEFKTITERDNEEIINELPFVKITYSENGWTNENVKAKLKVSNSNYKLLDGSKDVVFKKNGEKDIEFEYNGDIVRVRAKVSNIDKIKPKITTAVQNGINNATIVVRVEDDKLSPIKKIACSNGAVGQFDNDTNQIGRSFLVSANGKYTITAEDEAGNTSSVDVDVTGIGQTTPDTGNTDEGNNEQVTPPNTENNQESSTPNTENNQDTTIPNTENNQGNSSTVNGEENQTSSI